MAKNLGFTMEGLGFEDSISWSMQTINPPDTNVAHYPRLMYYYHPDYLGHVEYITDLDGVPYQHFYYTAWGETLLDQKANRPGMNFDSPYRFNGKELDEETGLYYYGARYYNPTVSVWLRVDPLAHKYPNMTSYVFTGNNPVMLVDPDGREIVVTGEGSDDFVCSLQNRTSMTVFRDQETGKITFEGKAKNKEDKRLLAMANSTDVKVEINAVVNTDDVPDRDDGAKFNGGAHIGTSFNCEQGYSKQVVNTAVLEGMTEMSFGEYDFVMHELYTAYYAGESVFKEGIKTDQPANFKRNVTNYEYGKGIANRYAPQYPSIKLFSPVNNLGEYLGLIGFHPYSNHFSDYKGGTVNSRTGEIKRNP